MTINVCLAILCNTFLFIETPFQVIIYGDQLTNMRPTQFVRHCLTNWIKKIKLPHIVEVRTAIPLPCPI